MEKPVPSAKPPRTAEPIKTLRTQVLDSLRQRFIAAGHKVPAAREEILHSRPYQANVCTILRTWIEELRRPTADPAQSREVIPVLLKLLRQVSEEMAQPAAPPRKVQRPKYLPTKRRGRRAKPTT